MSTIRKRRAAGWDEPEVGGSRAADAASEVGGSRAADVREGDCEDDHKPPAFRWREEGGLGRPQRARVTDGHVDEADALPMHQVARARVSKFDYWTRLGVSAALPVAKDLIGAEIAGEDEVEVAIVPHD